MHYRLDSNSICCGRWRKLTESYLNAEEKLPPGNKAATEVVAQKKGGSIKVVGIWNFGEPPKFERFYTEWAMPKKAREAANQLSSKHAFDLIGQR